MKSHLPFGKFSFSSVHIITHGKLEQLQLALLQSKTIDLSGFVLLIVTFTSLLSTPSALAKAKVKVCSPQLVIGLSQE